MVFPKKAGVAFENLDEECFVAYALFDNKKNFISSRVDANQEAKLRT